MLRFNAFRAVVSLPFPRRGTQVAQVVVWGLDSGLGAPRASGTGTTGRGRAGHGICSPKLEHIA